MSYSRLMPRVTMTHFGSGAAPGLPVTTCRSAVIAERCFYGVLGSRLGPRGGLLRVDLGLAHQRAVLQLANRLVGARNDLLALLETTR